MPVHFHKLSVDSEQGGILTARNNVEKIVTNNLSRNNLPAIKRSVSLKMNIFEEEQYASNDVLKEELIEETLPQEAKLYANVTNSNEINNTLSYLNKPTTHGIMMECSIYRKKVGSNRCFYLYCGNKFLLAAEKRNMASVHTISNSQDDIATNVVAVLNSNFLGTEFNLVKDNCALTTITYEFNLLGIKGPRKMRVYVPQFSGNDCQEFKIKNVIMV